ncbi:MAG: hypothetical protein CTY14_05335 [Methylotenera sp.]|nr:MAG: hypothetical protein CTY14_05335 [Methylotenera sp.]
MKNRYQEKLKKSAKSFHRNNRGERFSNGLIVRHQYDEADLTKLTWWDDVSCILNNYLVDIAWIHPRMAFKDQAEDEAHKMVAHLDSDIDDFLSQSEPNYAKVGKSRKKLVSHTMKGSLLSSDWTAAFDAAYAEMIEASNCQVTPYIKSKWVSGTRLVELCAPIEVRNEQDLMVIANLTIKLLKCETTLEKEFPNYIYTRDDWDLEKD